MCLSKSCFPIWFSGVRPQAWKTEIFFSFRSQWAFLLPDVHRWFQDVSMLRAIYSQKCFSSVASPRGKRRLMSHIISSIRLEERFVTMMNVLVLNLSETYTFGYICAVWQQWLRRHLGPLGGVGREAPCVPCDAVWKGWWVFPEFWKPWSFYKLLCITVELFPEGFCCCFVFGVKSRRLINKIIRKQLQQSGNEGKRIKLSSLYCWGWTLSEKWNCTAYQTLWLFISLVGLGG